MKTFDTAEMCELGIPVIDQQHRRILHFIRDLALATSSQFEAHAVRTAIHQMAEYSIQHFATEEAMMKADGYSEFTQHHQLHCAYNDTVKDFALRYGQHDGPSAAELVTWLWDWWMEHIQLTDRIWSVVHLARNI